MEKKVVNSNRIIARWLIAGILVILVVTLLAFAFVPELSETRIGQKIRFWQTPPPPPPAVPAGQLGNEVQQADTNRSSDTITIDPNTSTALGLQTAVIETETIDQSMQTTGRVTADERRITHVHTKVDGWIEKAFANYIGQQIRKGDALFTFYSPDLVATEQEYLIALRAQKDFQKSEFAVVQDSGDSLVNATRRRLQLWDLTNEQIEELEKTKTVHKEITFYAPASGFITERKVYPGVRIMPDTDLYTLADLSVVWIEADIFESDLSNIRIGTSGTITLPDGNQQSSRVTYINPMIDLQSRTAKVRFELLNNNLSLKPGMFVDVSFNISTRPQMIVPRDAVLDTGTRKVVLVDNGNNSFTLREIRTGIDGQDFYTVINGVSNGDKVARNIQFLIDSETPLRKAIEEKFGITGPQTQPGNITPNSTHSGESNIPLNPTQSMPNMPGMEGKGGKR